MEENKKYQNNGNSLYFDSNNSTNVENSNFHYLCPKCFNFPKIKFFDKDNIFYTCDCNNEKFLNIHDLFGKYNNKYLTFFDNDKIYQINDFNNYQNSGFRCKNHKKTKQHKFRYYCVSCKENLCKECCLYHYKEKHELIVLDFYYYNFYQKLIEINKNIKLDNDKAKNIINNNFLMMTKIV